MKKSKYRPFYEKRSVADINKIVAKVGVKLIDKIFINSNHRHTWHCQKHNHDFQRSFSQIYNGGYHCNKCRDEVGKWDSASGTGPWELNFSNPESYYAKNKALMRDAEVGSLGRGRRHLDFDIIKKIVKKELRGIPNRKSSTYVFNPDGKTDLRRRPIIIGKNFYREADVLAKCKQIKDIVGK